MTSLRFKVLAMCIAVTVSVAVAPTFAAAPEPTLTSIATTTTTTTTTTTVPETPDARCPMWWATATTEGFTPELLPTLDRVLYRESRCDPTQLNAADPNGGSLGLTQVNRFWCLPSKYYPNGYLQTVGVLSDCDELYDPATNLRAAFALVSYSLSEGLEPWAQWWWVADATKND